MKPEIQTLILTAACLCQAVLASGSKPNIIVIYTDDHGNGIWEKAEIP